ncbi:DUF134 domain-containing protein [Candidatus Calescamantes bacterium]|nr:DUF134 domain-containing protein [Candidatus Calescamantes bacterium]
MPRRKMQRIVHRPPLYTEFKPIGIRRSSLDSIELSIDEYEAIRLADLEGMDHASAAEKMGISRPTFSRLIESARKKAAEFLVTGAHLIIQGGSIHFKRNRCICIDCGERYFADMSDKSLICPKCGSRHIREFAGRFGHGDCCNQGRGRRNRGGNNAKR